MTFAESGGQLTTGMGPVSALEAGLVAALPALRAPVEAALRGNRSAGDIAYRLGELVHNHFRTRGKALTSFELRRYVIQLLDQHRNGWSALESPPAPAVRPEATELVSFSRPDLVAARRIETPPPPRPLPDTPSPLVTLAPRKADGAAPPPALETSNASALAAGVDVHSADPEAADESIQLALDRIAKAASDAMAPPVPAGAAAAAAPAEQPPHPPLDILRPSDATSTPAPTDAPQPVAIESAVARPVDPAAAWAAVRTAMERLRSQAPQTPAPRRLLMAWARPLLGAELMAAGLSVEEPRRAALERLAVDELFGLGPLEGPMGDPAVTAIFVNGPAGTFVERDGKLQPTPSAAFRDDAHLAEILGRIARRAGVEPLGDRVAISEGKVRGGGRFTMIGPPLATGGAIYAAIRKVAAMRSLSELAEQGLLSKQAAAVLSLAVRGRLGVLICGAAETGKTTLLGALARSAEIAERTVVVDRDGALRLTGAQVVALNPPVDGAALRGFFGAALRLRPDRIVFDAESAAEIVRLAEVGEGSNVGLLATIEAADAAGAVAVVEAGVAASAPDQAAPRRRLRSAFDIVVDLTGARHGGRGARLYEFADEGPAASPLRDLAVAGVLVAGEAAPSSLERRMRSPELAEAMRSALKALQIA